MANTSSITKKNIPKNHEKKYKYNRTRNKIDCYSTNYEDQVVEFIYSYLHLNLGSFPLGIRPSNIYENILKG